MITLLETEKPSDLKNVRGKIIFYDDELADNLKKTAELHIADYDLEKFEVYGFKEYQEVQIEENEILHAYIVDLDLGNGTEEGLNILKKLKNKSENNIVIVYSSYVSNDEEELIKSYAVNPDNVIFKSEVEKDLPVILQTIKNKCNLRIIENINKINKDLKYLYKERFLVQVADMEENAVMLVVSKENGDTKELWFEKSRVDKPENIEFNSYYYMYDEITNYGESWLHFKKAINHINKDEDSEEDFKLIYENSEIFK
jgi:DNA-binding NarL/FixJ family response regulator